MKASGRLSDLSSDPVCRGLESCTRVFERERQSAEGLRFQQGVGCRWVFTCADALFRPSTDESPVWIGFQLPTIHLERARTSLEPLMPLRCASTTIITLHSVHLVRWWTSFRPLDEYLLCVLFTGIHACKLGH